MRPIRKLNGYVLVYDPTHARAMHSSGYNGYVYEHIKVATAALGRDLHADEVVHHLDGDRSNNRNANLLVLMRSQHGKLHMWLAGVSEQKCPDENRVNSVESDRCRICGATLQSKQHVYCSLACYTKAQRDLSASPTREILAADIASGASMCALGRKYGVSDNAVRKWVIRYGIDTTILSQAAGTLAEGAETSGVVQST